MEFDGAIADPRRLGRYDCLHGDGVYITVYWDS